MPPVKIDENNNNNNYYYNGSSSASRFVPPLHSQLRHEGGARTRYFETKHRETSFLFRPRQYRGPADIIDEALGIVQKHALTKRTNQSSTSPVLSSNASLSSSLSFLSFPQEQDSARQHRPHNDDENSNNNDDDNKNNENQ